MAELIASISNYMKAELNLTFVGRTFLYPFVIVLAGVMKILYLYAASINKNIWIDTADSEESGGNLERFARVILGRERLPAIQGQYELILNITANATTVQAGTTWKQPNGDYLFVLDTTEVLDIGAFGVIVRALEAGNVSRLNVGDELEATQPLANVDQIGVISSVSIEPTDGESVEDYRNAAIETFNSEPTGGSGADYRGWARDVPSIRTVYPYVKESEAGTVQIYVESLPTGADEFEPTLPTTEQKELLYLPITIDINTVIRTGVLILDPDETKPENDRGRMPVGVFDLEILDIVLIDVDVIINNLQIPSTGIAEVQQRIETAVKQYSYEIRPFVSGSDDPNSRTDTLRQVDLASVVIQSLNEGETVDQVEMQIGGLQEDFRLFTFGDVPNITVVFV